jgi:hypothetical protein
MGDMVGESFIRGALFLALLLFANMGDRPARPAETPADKDRPSSA